MTIDIFTALTRVEAAEENIITPENEKILAWMALMQHYGAPTRLLDWSYSFFVALFFAIESSHGDAALYAIDARWSNEESRNQLPDPGGAERAIAKDPYFAKPATFQSVFSREPSIALVYRLNTFFVNTRLAVQQGLFLCPGAIEHGFEQNLDALRPPSASSEAPVLYKLKICRNMHQDALAELGHMNIGRHSLFSGLDGLAQSLQQYLRYSDRLYPPWRKKVGGRPFAGWSRWEGWTDEADDFQSSFGRSTVVKDFRPLCGSQRQRRLAGLIPDDSSLQPQVSRATHCKLQ
jgi:hypothetical protein